MSKELDNLKSMSLGDHLEELRGRLILMIVGIFVGLVISLFFGKFLVRLLELPYYHAMTKIQDERIEQKQEEESESEAEKDAVKTDEGITEPEVPIVAEVIAEPEEPLTETDRLRAALDQLRADFEELKIKLLEVSTAAPLTSMAPAESFKTYIKVCLVFGLLFSSPWVIWQIWAFVSSGLYKKEKQFAHTIAPASTVLFVSGVLFFMFIVAPLMMKFFIDFDQMMGIVSRWTLQYYTNLVLTLGLIFGVAFQMPIVIVFAEKVGLVTIEQLSSSRKYVILGIVVVAAVATPPDIVSQVLLAVPLYGLYEGSVVVCRVLRWRKNKQTA